MDLLAHAMYGATVCSRAGLAGRIRGRTRRRLMADWTVWCAALFGILPDVVSMGVPFLFFLVAGMPDNFFRHFDENNLVLYRYVHSLIVALAVSGFLRLVFKPLFIPSLAWPLHILLDSLTHGLGKFRTPLFYPLSDWAFGGMPFWRHPEVVLAYWVLLPVIWLGLRAAQRSRKV